MLKWKALGKEMASLEVKGCDVAANPFELKTFDLFGDWRFVILISSLGYIILAELLDYNSMPHILCC